jgi:hypothetical protein
VQVCEHLQALGKQVGIRVIALVGGIAPVKQVGSGGDGGGDGGGGGGGGGDMQ